MTQISMLPPELGNITRAALHPTHGLYLPFQSRHIPSAGTREPSFSREPGRPRACPATRLRTGTGAGPGWSAYPGPSGSFIPPLPPVRAPWAARPKPDPCRFCDAESPTEEKEMRAARSALQIGMILASRLGSLASSKEAKPRERMSTAPPPRPDTYVVDVLSVRGGASRRHCRQQRVSRRVLRHLDWGPTPERGSSRGEERLCVCFSSRDRRAHRRSTLLFLRHAARLAQAVAATCSARSLAFQPALRRNFETCLGLCGLQQKADSDSQDS